jgi:hypothetical protein
LEIRLNFHEVPIFWKSALIFMRRQYFGQAPMFYDFASFLLLQIFVYISVFIYASLCAPIFLAQLF